MSYADLSPAPHGTAQAHKGRRRERLQVDRGLMVVSTKRRTCINGAAF